MKPRIFEIDPYRMDLELLKQAAEIIHNRGLVVFPTETVYGLGANALDPKAVVGIFEAKKRPFDDPLIVHIADKKDLEKLAGPISSKAEKLIERFWPGPLTLILKKADIVPDIVTTGLDTVGIRMPSNPIARKFIEIVGKPIAAPSANLFGKPSPTTVKHVMEDLDGRIDVVLDGGSTEIGIESTVVEIVDDSVKVLRPGGISIEELEGIAGGVEVVVETAYMHHSPGQYSQHYSPKARVVVVDDVPEQSEKVLSLVKDMTGNGQKVGVLAKQENENIYKDLHVKVLGPQDDGKTCAARLFHLLREFDSDMVDIIVAEAIPEQGLALAVMNRLRKAAGPDLFSM